MLACAGCDAYLDPIKDGKRLTLMYNITTISRELRTAGSPLQDFRTAMASEGRRGRTVYILGQ